MQFKKWFHKDKTTQKKNTFILVFLVVFREKQWTVGKETKSSDGEQEEEDYSYQGKTFQ